MGAYLSEPVTEKVSSDENNANLVCGASSMQGWRVNQEDAHNTILNYDESTSLFAVYDGHGGAEVAAYCAQKLPDFIKATEAYKVGDMDKALVDAFLSFDETIASKEVLAILKELAGDKKPDEPEEEENVKDLYQEASMPLEDIIAKYQEVKVKTPLSKLKATEDSSPLSPFLRARKSDLEDVDGPSGSGEKLKVEGSTKDADVSSSTNTSGNNKNANGDQQVSTSDTENVGTTIEKVIVKEVASVPDSSDDNCDKPEQSQDAKTAQSTTETTQTEPCNGEVTESKLELKENDISSSQNGETPPKIKSGKAKDKSSGISSTDAASKPTDETTEKGPKLNIRRAAALYNTMLEKMRTEEDEDDSDSNDETFQGEESSSSEETVNGVSDSSNEADADEEESSSEAEEEYPDDYTMNEEPGADSGCTAVVALLRGNQLYVANAGDSRCIVSREGKAIEMSIDHKPEDSPEWERIEKAGGKVTIDGRVNGGLNLSRAIGDHSYKQNKELDAREQMITALPDIKTLTIDPALDEFMVLACDGIWNFMSSQDVVDFITPRLAAAPERLSQICEEMFDHCLAPTNIGDGTGCDNMTAVIVKFKHKTTPPSQEAPSTEGVSTTDCPKKRVADGEPSDSQDSKRQRVQDETLSSAVVTSSV